MIGWEKADRILSPIRNEWKIVVGVAEAIAGAILIATGVGVGLGVSLLIMGGSMILAGVAQMLTPAQRQTVTIRQPNTPRQIVYGQMRIGGVSGYLSTTGSNTVIHEIVMWASHRIQSIDAVYVDGRQILPNHDGVSSYYGSCDGSTHYDDDNVQYNLKGDVYVEHSMGTPSGHVWGSLGGYDYKWNSNCTLNGIAATYFRVNYDNTIFPSIPPNFTATIHGKNDIYDPRLGTYGASGTTAWTNNLALCVLDILLNKDYGLGCDISEINLTNFVAQANLCDQQVLLANSPYAARYTCNGVFTSEQTPGEIIESMCAAGAARLVAIAGQWNLFVGAWYGSSATFGADQLIGPVRWNYRKFRELANGVRGQYVAATYPYAVVTSGGARVDQNTKLSGTFSGEYQPADIPPYMQDALHGYPSDANLAADGGNRLWMDCQLRFCTDCAQAQRVAKINLLRNRQRGSGSLLMNLWAYQCVPTDVIQVSFAPLNWTAKYLEVQGVKFVPPQLSMTTQQEDSSDEKNDLSKQMYIELSVSETDPSVYAWSTAEELSPTDNASPTLGNFWLVNPPTGLTLQSNSGTAYVGADGVSLPRLQVNWTQPNDVAVSSGGHIQVQYQQVGASSWTPAGTLDPTAVQYYITGVVSGTQYNVQIRALRSNNAASDWVVAGPITASATATSMDTIVNGTTYQKVLASQMQNGVVLGKTQGTNMLLNPGFEQQSSSSNTLGDGWSGTATSQWNLIRETGGGGQAGSACDLLVRLMPNASFPAAAQNGAGSNYMPVTPGKSYQVSGYYRWDANIAQPAGLIQFVTLQYYDISYSPISGGQNSASSSAGAGWQYFIFNNVAPASAAYAVLFCNGAWYPTSLPATAPNGLAADFRFDNLAVVPSVGSGLFAAQGSIMPYQTTSIAYSATNSSISFSWGATSLLRSDQTTLSVPSGSLSVSSLSASTTYYFYFYVDPVSGVVSCVTGSSTPPTSPNSTYAIQAQQDGRMPLAPMSITTLAAGSSGSSGGSGGGGSTCPEETELVKLQDGTMVAAGEIKVGDWIKGHSFVTNADVYRRVVSVRKEVCASWRVINGHLLSPREPVYFDGKWMPAYQASSTVDNRVSRKVLITVDAGEDAEHNYYIVGGTNLLIHNSLAYTC